VVYYGIHFRVSLPNSDWWKKWIYGSILFCASCSSNTTMCVK
jgi:hypothetical protein